MSGIFIENEYAADGEVDTWIVGVEPAENVAGDSPNTPQQNFRESEIETNVILNGSPNNLPTTSTPVDGQKSNPFDFAVARDLAVNASKIARDVGTAIGTLRREITAAPGAFSSAEKAAANNNKIQQWWLYSSPTDKLTVGIGLVGLVYLFVTHK